MNGWICYFMKITTFLIKLNLHLQMESYPFLIGFDMNQNSVLINHFLLFLIQKKYHKILEIYYFLFMIHKVRNTGYSIISI